MITPTIGRKVWFYFAAHTLEQDATVIDVHPDGKVTLFVITRGGTPEVRRFVQLVQEGEDILEGEHATWMPYQVNTAKKEALVAALPPVEPPAPPAENVAPQADPVEPIAEAPDSAPGASAPDAPPPPPADDAHVAVGSSLFSDPSTLKE